MMKLLLPALLLSAAPAYAQGAAGSPSTESPARREMAPASAERQAAMVLQRKTDTLALKLGAHSPAVVLRHKTGTLERKLSERARDPGR